MPAFKDDYHKKNFGLKKQLKNLFGFKPDGFNENLFEYAGVLWQGNLDGSVDNNPICIRCFTQLSFENKDMVICDTCHKSGDKIGIFSFKLNGVSVLYAVVYDGAKKRWADILINKNK